MPRFLHTLRQRLRHVLVAAVQVIVPKDVHLETGVELRPGGRLILTAPFCSASHFAPYHFHTGFTRYFYEHHLPRSGLTLVSLTANGDYFSYLAHELRRLPVMAGTYAGRTIGATTHLALVLLLRSLGALRRTDRRSEEFLCFGYHLVADKQITA